MTTFHEAAAADLFEAMSQDPHDAALLAQVHARLDTRFPDWLMDLIGQTLQSPASWPQAQVAAFTDVVHRLSQGRVARRRIPLGHTPGSDSDRTGNAERLLSLPAPFVARLSMTQNGADSDGALEWDSPVTAWRSTTAQILNAHALHSAIHAPFDLRPWSVPLEVGYTLPSRTWAHLAVEGAVARWPYGSKEIHLLVCLERLGGFVSTRPLPADIKTSSPL